MQRFGEDGSRLLGERIARKAQPGRRLFLLFGDGGLASGRSGVEACRQCGEAMRVQMIRFISGSV